MAQIFSPELYLSLLAGRERDVSHILGERRAIKLVGESRLSVTQDLERSSFHDVLDALASICIHDREVFFVSLAVSLDEATLYVSTNGEVPATATAHLANIQQRLKALKAVLEPGPPSNVESPDPNHTQDRADGELGLQSMIYEYSYPKLRRRYRKRGPAILERYKSITSNFLGSDAEENERFDETRGLLLRIDKLMKGGKPPPGPRLVSLIRGITLLNNIWQEQLKHIGDNDSLGKWDRATIVHCNGDLNKCRTLSLRRLLEKVLSLHRHIKAILRIACSHRLSPFLESQFHVVPLPAAQGDIHLELSAQNVLHIAFPTKGETIQLENVEKMVYHKLLDQLRAKAEKEGINIGTGIGGAPALSLTRINMHAESNLLVYHLAHPEIHSYPYFGGSKLSCHGCSTLFSAFNGVADSFGLSQYSTRGSHHKIYPSLRWSFPSLLPQERQSQLQADTLSLDIAVRKGMVEILDRELAVYVGELRRAAGSTSPWADSTGTTASDDWNMEAECLLEEIETYFASEPVEEDDDRWDVDGPG